MTAPRHPSTHNRPSSRRALSRGFWAGWLWLALLLPLSQAVVTWHAHVHAEEAAGGRSEPQHAPGLTHCDVCLAAAALSGGALAAQGFALWLAEARQAPPCTVAASVWLASLRLAYRSRAPPISAV